MNTDTIVLATRNQGKVAEFAMLLQPFNVKVVGLDAFPFMEDVEETGSTFEENAFLKASQVSRVTKYVALADDSGLEVDFLNKAPGVYSARYSATPLEPATDAKNREKVLQALEGVPLRQRSGRFRCSLVACTPFGETLEADGSWEGLIAFEEKGENGFGYDSIFYDPEFECTAAMMTKEEKNKLSHRGKAVEALLKKWPAFWQAWLSASEK